MGSYGLLDIEVFVDFGHGKLLVLSQQVNDCDPDRMCNGSQNFRRSLKKVNVEFTFHDRPYEVPRSITLYMDSKV